MREHLSTRVSHALYATGWALVKALPEPVARWLFRMMADAAWRRRGAGVRRLEANLRRVVGPTMPDADLDRLVRAGMRSYLRYWMELFRLPAISPDRVVSRMEIMGYPPLREAFEAGRGVILALPHTGNWDHAGAWAVLQGLPVTTVAERVRPEDLFDKFVAFRESLGMEVLPLTGSGRSVFGTLAQRLRAGRVVCLVADRDLSENGIPVTFFGAKTSMPGGPAALALHTGAALFPVTLSFTRGGWAATVHPEIVPPTDGKREEKLQAMTQAMADDFAAGIAAFPQDWHMLQPFWLDDRPAAGP